MEYCEHPSKFSMFCDPTTSVEIYNLIMNLKNNKAPGPDNIGPKLIKFVAGEICNPLQYIYNLSFEQGIIPDKLKLAKVIPVFKSGDPTLPSNYRPISLLDIFDKLLEKLMVTRLCRFLQQNNILYEYQFGFRQHYSTTFALIDVVDDIYKDLDNNETGIGIYLDLKSL